MKSEAQIWREERERIAKKQTARQRSIVRWFVRTSEPDPYVWHSVEELIEGRS